MSVGRELHRGRVGGGGRRVGGHQPVQYRRRAGAVSAGQRRGCGAGDRGRAGCVPGLVAQHAAAAPRHPQAHRRRAAGAQGRDRRHPVARGGQAARRGDRRDGARGADLPVLLRRGAAADRRQAGLGAAGGRHRDHARARGRGRDDLSLELPDRDPGLEDGTRPGLRQLRRAQAGRAGAGDRHSAGRDHRPRRRPARRVQPGHRPRLGGGRGDAAPSGRERDHLHRLGRRPAAGWPRPASRPTR